MTHLAEAPPERRHYRILGVLGRGGFGVVYKARMEGADGFVKDVAVKILTVHSPTSETLARFRDEARILGQLHDRAIVGVDPPVLLDGRWALIMEFVEGCDCRRLLQTHSSLPPLVALDIVQEVARALDTLWTCSGDSGGPMRLLHRDLKPGNIQITPFGTVKVLDFGVARADFEQRETVTTHHIGGTLGYVAPERLNGIEGPGGDIWSLGVVLEELVTGQRPNADADQSSNGAATLAPEVLAAVELARRMRARSAGDRPSAATVEVECRRLAQSHTGPTLRAWARTHVTSSLDAPDDLVGLTLSPTPGRSDASFPSLVAHPARQVRLPRSVVLMVVALLAVALFVSGQSRTESADAPIPASALVAQPVSLPSSDPSTSEPTTSTAVLTPALDVPTPSPPIVPARPTSPPADATGRVEFEGATGLGLSNESGTWMPDRVPPGTYTVHAMFDGGPPVNAGQVTVRSGETVRLECNTRFQRCKAR